MTAKQRKNDFLEYFENRKVKTGKQCQGYYKPTINKFSGENNLDEEAKKRKYVQNSFFELDSTRIDDVKALHKWACKNTRIISHGNPSGVLSQYIDYLTDYPSGFTGSSSSTGVGTPMTNPTKTVTMTRPSYGATASMSFDYIAERGMTLTPAQEDLLRRIERTSCALDEFSCIRELRRAKRYRVVVSDKKSFIDTVNKELVAYGNYIDSLNNKFQRNSNSLTERERELMHTEILWCIKSNLENNLKRLQSTDGQVLLGLYRNWDYSYNSPTIYLFKENIDAYAAREGVSPDYVFGFVYIHEAMHAFFNSKNAEGYLSVSELEEAFAECGILDFLTRVGSALPKDLYVAAKQNVLQKQYNGPYEYGFGLALYEISSSYGVTSKIISRYREISNWIGRAMEVYKVRRLQRVSEPDTNYDSAAAECYALVEKILAGSYSAPAYDLTILPGLSKYMRAAGVVLKPTSRVAGSFPSILPGNGWPAHLYSGSNLRPLVQLAVTDSVDDVVYAIFKSLERRFPWLLENVIRSLNIQTRPAGDTSVPGEWLSRSINFRDDGAKDIQGGWSFGAGLRPENTSVVCLLRAVSMFGGDGNEFYVLANDGKYVLFGSAKFRRSLEE